MAMAAGAPWCSLPWSLRAMVAPDGNGQRRGCTTQHRSPPHHACARARTRTHAHARARRDAHRRAAATTKGRQRLIQVKHGRRAAWPGGVARRKHKSQPVFRAAESAGAPPVDRVWVGRAPEDLGGGCTNRPINDSEPRRRPQRGARGHFFFFCFSFLAFSFFFFFHSSRHRWRKEAGIARGGGGKCISYSFASTAPLASITARPRWIAKTSSSAAY